MCLFTTIKRKRLHDLRSQATIWILLAWHPGHRSHTEYSHITLWQQLKLRSVFIRPKVTLAKLKFLNQTPFMRHEDQDCDTFYYRKIKCSQRGKSSVEMKEKSKMRMRNGTTYHWIQLSKINCQLSSACYILEIMLTALHILSCLNLKTNL